MSWDYITTVRWVGKEVPLQLPEGFPGVRPRIVLKGGNAISSCFPIVLDLNFCFPQQNTGIYFCIDDLASLKKSSQTIMRHVPHSPSLKALHHSNTHVLERPASPTCFFEPLKNFQTLDPPCSKKFNVLFHANWHFQFIHLPCRAQTRLNKLTTT